VNPEPVDSATTASEELQPRVHGCIRRDVKSGLAPASTVALRRLLRGRRVGCPRPSLGVSFRLLRLRIPGRFCGLWRRL